MPIGSRITVNKAVNNYYPHLKDEDGNVFSLFTLGGGGVPRPGPDGGYPSQVQLGYPLARSGGGYPG